MRKNLLLTVFLFSAFSVFAQVSETDKATATDLVRKNSSAIGVSFQDIDNSIITGTYIIPGSDVRMVYLQQSYKGIPVYNQLHVLAFRNGKIVSTAGSRVLSIESKVNSNGAPAIDPVKAVKTALTDINAEAKELIVPVNILNEGRRFEFGSLGVSTENIFAELIWFPVEDGKSARLAWQVFAAPQNSSAYWLIRVDAMTNTVISKEDLTISCNWGPEGTHDGHKHAAKEHQPSQKTFVEKRNNKENREYKNDLINTATYRVIRYPAESPIHPGGAPSLHTDPWLMSPGNATTLQWHDDGTITYDSTRGNNAFAYDDRDANNLPGRSGVSSTPLPNLTLDFVPDFTLEPTVRTPAPNQQFNTTNLFYWNNLMHDLSYLYGFTETARNYQNNNLGRGGVGGDYVLAEAQDGSGTNNANFSSGVEGTRGRMQMYLWTAPTPDRDGDVDNGIIAHEYTHGISNRMTGTGAGCLSVVEQAGEGWSDYLGLMITHNWATAVPSDGFNNPRGIGTYALNQPITGPGIRQYRYTTNMAINPMTYGNLPSVAVPHGVGTIWCTALWDMTWYIIQQAGINPNLFNPAGTGGNSIALKLVIEGLRLQPCNPGFIDSRNAIMKADTIFFGAQYSCAILEAFARRGMGVGASQGSASIRGDETLSFDNGKPAITAHPQSVSLCTGANHTFTVAATGVNLSYQWRLSTDGGATYNNIPGATSASYSLTGVTAGMNNYRYRCVVSGCPPSVTSNEAILTVTAQPSITSQPVNATVCEGNNASFVAASGNANPQYQWQLSTDGGANYTNISGATNATLNLTAVTAAMNNNRYRCVVSVSGCAATATSSAAVLTVNTLPAINSQPAAAAVCEGSNTSFSITAIGTGITYQWQISTDGGANWSNITGATSSVYNITGATTGMNNNRYRCIISGTCTPGATSSSALLTVVAPVTFVTQPAGSEICSGSNTSFSIAATSSETISYQWQVSTDGGANWSNVPNTGVYSGAGTATLSIAAAGTGLSTYRYRCVVSSATCSSPVNSLSATLIVRQLPSVTLTAAPLTALLPGQITTLTATPSASTGGTLSTVWFFNNNQVPNTGNTRQVNVEQVGSYRVRVQETFSSGITCTNQSADVLIDAKVSDKLFIFPNPNDGRFTVSYYNNGGSSTQRRIIVIDAKGARIYDRQFSITGPYTLLQIDMRNAGRGIHIVLVGDAAGTKLAEGKVHVR
ncbi:MAG: M36 family metallopeptidase [Bacteroidota bacterium]